MSVAVGKEELIAGICLRRQARHYLYQEIWRQEPELKISYIEQKG